MEEYNKLSDVTLLDRATKTSLPSTWVEKHADLIAKLEAEYKLPQETKNVSSDNRYYGFNIGELNLLISKHIHSEILEDNTIYPIPLAPNWLLGTCNVRGDIVPIIDLEQIITGKIKIAEHTEYKTLILDEAENSIGLPLAKLPTPIHFKKEDRVKNYSELPDLVQPFITVGFKRKQKIWVCIDLFSFLASFTN